MKAKLSLVIKQLREIKRTCGDIEVDVLGLSLTGLKRLSEKKGKK